MASNKSIDKSKLLKRLNKDVKKIYADVVAKYNLEVDRVITDPNEFANLGFVEQDIVDTGRLRDSKIIETQGELSTRFSWDPVDPETGYHYASAVFWGFNAYGGSKFVPGRPWSERAVYNHDPVNYFAARLKKAGYNAKVVRDDTRTIGLP
ncbi:MAG: hypothetical protein QNJ54_01710 [Prochloraceae cyanobacterium]|nr:hypothetical protein [Prochloraceae cyanobacterium]